MPNLTLIAVINNFVTLYGINGFFATQSFLNWFRLLSVLFTFSNHS